MADPHRTYDDEDDLDMDSGAAEDNAVAQAIQNSLESFSQVGEEISQIPNDTAEVPRNTRGSPQLSFPAEKIAEDERRRDRELYGPPTPPQTTSAVTSLNPIPDHFTSRESDKTHSNSKNKVTKHFDKASKNSSEDDSTAYFIKRAINTVNKVIVERYLAMKGVSSTGKTENLPITEFIRAIKIGAHFSTVYIPTDDASLEALSSISDFEGAADVADTDPYIQDPEAFSAFLHASPDQYSRHSSTDYVTASELGQYPPGQEAEMAGMVSPPMPAQSQSLDAAADSALEQLFQETEDKINKEDDNSAPPDSATRVQGSLPPAGSVAASDLANKYIESGRVSEHFDNNIVHSHAARLADIDAALDSHHVGLGAALEAARARGATRGAIVPAPASAAADSAGDEEVERFLDEGLVSPRAVPEEDRPPHQTTRPQ